MPENIVHVYRRDMADTVDHWPKLLLGAAVSAIEEADGGILLQFDCGLEIIIPGGLVMVHRLPN